MDPREVAEEGRRLSGIEYVQAIVTGELPAPPISELMGFRLVLAEPGRAVFEMEPGPQHYNPIGSVHGGVYATLLDSAAGCAVHTMLPAGVGYTSLDLTVKFLRPITVDTGRVRCIGTVPHLGGRTALAQAELLDGRDRLLGTAVSSILLIRPEPGAAVN